MSGIVLERTSSGLDIPKMPTLGADASMYYNCSLAQGGRWEAVRWVEEAQISKVPEFSRVGLGSF